MVGLSTSMFSQLQMVNDSIYSSGKLICVIHPIDNAIVAMYKIDEKTKKSISVLARVEYPKSKFEFYTTYDSPELTPKEERIIKKDIKNHIKDAGVYLEEGATLILVGMSLGMVLTYTANPILGILVSLSCTVVGYVKLIKAGQELQNHELNLVN